MPADQFTSVDGDWVVVSDRLTSALESMEQMTRDEFRAFMKARIAFLDKRRRDKPSTASR